MLSVARCCMLSQQSRPLKGVRSIDLHKVLDKNDAAFEAIILLDQSHGPITQRML